MEWLLHQPIALGETVACGKIDLVPLLAGHFPIACGCAHANALGLGGADNGGTKLWWDKNPNH